MDTLEATTTVLQFWPTSFRGEHWRKQLSDELETWNGLERRQVIDKLKVSHNAKRISLEIMKQVRGGLGLSSKPSGPNLAERERVALEWMAAEGMQSAFLNLDYGDRIPVERLIWAMQNEHDWRERLSEQAGSPKYWQPWERVSNLQYAAALCRVAGMDVLTASYEQVKQGLAWIPWHGSRRIDLPPPPTMPTRHKIDHEELLTARLNKRLAVDAVPTQPQSPPTAMDDFDGCSDGPN